MKFKELASLDEKALASKEKELKLELVKENSQVASGTTPKSPGRLRELKKTVAKIRTLQTQRSVKNNE